MSNKKVEFTERQYFGFVEKYKGKKRIALFMQYRIVDGVMQSPFLGLSEEYFDNGQWKYGKAVTFPPRLIDEIQKLINSIKQEAIENMTAPTLDKKEPF